MLIVISGLTVDESGNKGSAGAGKDTAARQLVEKHGFVQLSLSDPMKRFVQELFQFTDDQVWGPTHFRNKPDERYPRLDAQNVADIVRPGREPYLTPRYALQQLGTAWGRDCWEDVWSAYAYRIYERLQQRDCYYDQKMGLRHWASTLQDSPVRAKINVVISDLRFKNEFNFFKGKSGAFIVRVCRPVKELFVKNDHQSENDLNDVPDDAFDYVIQGRDNDVAGLQLLVDKMYVELLVRKQCSDVI